MVSLLSADTVLGQVRFFAVASEQNLSLNQPFQVQYVVQGTRTVSKIMVPNTPDFNVEDVFNSPLTPTIDHKSLQWVDTYSRIVVLTPTRTGKFIIPGATVVIDGKKMRSNPLKITVTQTGLSSILSPTESVVDDESEIKVGEDLDEKVRKNFFLRAVPTKTSCYVGEPIEVNYKAYSRVNSNSQVVKRPSFPGFSVVEMVDAYDNKADIERVKGIAFYSNLIRKVQLFPLQSGTFELDAAEIESVIHFVRVAGNKARLGKLLDPSSNVSLRMPFDHRVSLRTAPVSITVKPLPEKDQPADFAGAVGQFSFTAELQRTDIRRGELVKVRWVINGKGNLPLITLPDVKWPAGLDTSEPSVKEDLNHYVYPLNGKKIFEYSFSAKDSGDYVIPPVSFSYFDPAEAVYKTILSDSLSFHVKENAGLAPGNTGAGYSNSEGIPKHLYFFAAIVLIILGWIGYQLVHLQKARKANRVALLSSKKQKEIAEAVPEKIDEFNNAKKSLLNEDKHGFYNEVQRVVWKITAEKCQILPSALNKHNISFRLRLQEIPENTISEISGVLSECEWALYTPEHNTEGMELLLKRAEAVVEELERT